MTKRASAVQRRRPKRSAESVDKDGSERYLSKAIGRALDVLDLFPDENCYLNLKEISARMNLPESSLFRILVTLRDRAYMRQDSSGCYRLADKVLFGKVRDQAGEPRERAHPNSAGDTIDRQRHRGHMINARTFVLTRRWPRLPGSPNESPKPPIISVAAFQPCR
jgi:hypothetical protein